MINLQAFKEKLSKLQHVARTTSPSLSVTLDLPILLNWIMNPQEEVGEFGLLSCRVIHRQLAEYLERQPAFNLYCVIEYGDDGDIFLWRKKDWLTRSVVQIAKAEKDIEDCIEGNERRERFDIVLKALCEWGPMYKTNKGLAQQTIEMMVSKASKGDTKAITFLTQLGYYQPLKD